MRECGTRTTSRRRPVVVVEFSAETLLTLDRSCIGEMGSKQQGKELLFQLGDAVPTPWDLALSGKHTSGAAPPPRHTRTTPGARVASLLAVSSAAASASIDDFGAVVDEMTFGTL